jgi:hypothetical protein
MAASPRRRRRTSPLKPPRNTAPMWKKLTIVISAAIVAAVVMSTLSGANMGFFLVLVCVLAAVAADVWLVAKLVGVHLSLRSWD